MQIAASLRGNNVLESLDVSGNSLYIQGAEAFAAAVRVGGAPKTMNMSD